jgi:acetyl-CoA C-acetyltransferase
MPKTVILGAARTPFGKLGGGLASLDATELGGRAMAAALERAEVAPEQIQHVSYGQVLQAGQGQIPSRQAQVKAGIPKEVSSETINKVCASGIRSVGMIDQSIGLATSTSPSQAGWSRCRGRRISSRMLGSATGWATRRRSTR